MIFHAFSPNLPRNPTARFTYWTLHGETLTPVRVSVGHGGRVTLNIFLHPTTEIPVFSSHPDGNLSQEAITEEVMTSICSANPRLSHRATRFFTREEVEIPEYLIVFDINGENPAVARTQDPHFIIAINEREEMLSSEHSYCRTTIDLSAEGWCYWWQDAQAAYETLVATILDATSSSSDSV